MPKESSPSERILNAAETALRRYGAEKTNVVDIARALDMSHGNIYRHFRSKKELLDAVALRWLHTLHQPLEAITTDRALPASERLGLWFDALRKAKKRKLRDDPELFRMHYYIAENSPEMVTEHVGSLLAQIERIISDGVTSKEFPPGLNPKAAARSFFLMTAPFHHPALLLQGPPPADADAKLVLRMFVAGLRAGAA